MKKFLVSALAIFILVSFGSTLAQTLDTEGHRVTVTLPEVAFLRFTNDIDSRGVYGGNLDLVFAPDAAAVEAGVPTARTNTTADWGDLKVFVNRAISWSVTVTTVQDLADPVAFGWGKIGTSGFNINGGTAGTGTTNGWHSLGFGAADFRLTLDGTEVQGTYNATVTYTLTTP